MWLVHVSHFCAEYHHQLTCHVRHRLVPAHVHIGGRQSVGAGVTGNGMRVKTWREGGEWLKEANVVSEPPIGGYRAGPGGGVGALVPEVGAFVVGRDHVRVLTQPLVQVGRSALGHPCISCKINSE
jgi:hypothetical protein